VRAPSFIVISGLPGSGKSSLARGIAPLLDLEVIDKDDFLEKLFGDRAEVDSALRFSLSRRADDEMRKKADASSGAVLISFWRRDELSSSSGTPTDWLVDLPRLIEVYCDCDASTAMQRFLLRHRHPGHGDAAKGRDTLKNQFEALAKLGPIGVGDLVVVDMRRPVDVQSLVSRLEAISAAR